MSTLDLHDIQGNIHRPYGRYGFPYAALLPVPHQPERTTRGAATA